jgi:hypothetical protein
MPRDGIKYQECLPENSMAEGDTKNSTSTLGFTTFEEVDNYFIVDIKDKEKFAKSGFRNKNETVYYLGL